MIEKFFKKCIDGLHIYPYEVEKYGEDLVSMFAVGREFVKLMGNESPYPPSPKVIEVLNRFDLFNRYPDPTYLRLRRKLSDYTGVDVGKILVGPGSLSLIDTVFKSLIKPGDKIFIHLPTYPPYLDRIVVYGGLISAVRICLNRGKVYIDHGESLHIAREAKIIIIINPNNPVGYVISQDDIIKYLNSDKIVIVDEAYFEFYGESVIDLIDEFENLIILRTLSKAFGLAGLRLGYLISNENVVKYLRKSMSPYLLSSLIEELGIAALSDDIYMKTVVDKIVKERERVYKELLAINGVTPYESMTNFILVRVDHPNYPDVGKLVMDLLAKRILVRDLSKREGLEYGKYFRVTIGTKEENDMFLSSLIKLLGE